MIVLYATFPDQPTAEKICETLVTEKLAACANVLAPMQSIYPWEGRIEKSREVPALLKTADARLAALEKRFQELHPYDVPCLIQLNGDYCIPGYARWIGENT